MKIAVIHDWLVTYAGSERVLEQILNAYPDADIFTVVDHLKPEERGFIKNKRTHTSFIQKLPMSKKLYRHYLPLMPLAIEQFDLSEYDVVISSSHAVAKGVITGPNQLHISYVHTPIRYAWDLQHQYLRESGMTKGLKSMVTRWLLHNIRLWDYRTSNGVNSFLSNSKYISKRIWKAYRRESEVIYPPVDVEAFDFYPDKEEYYFTASRMVPYKKMDLIVEAFAQMPDKRLIVIGDGPDMKKIASKAGPNVELMGYQKFQTLKMHMSQAKAFVFAAEEDFGITPVEAQACGTPVIAFGKGGALETVKGLDTYSEPTGVFFYEQSVEAIVESVNRFEARSAEIKPIYCRNNSLSFSNERFIAEFKAHVEREYCQFAAAEMPVKVLAL
ncbi:glycosyltransferase family 4 protein [Paenibacillus methanolicus]|uniref:Glycosyltransferase involved in cell wall biosynthesis n=1 Tax=Paenibacillus methanolicus TaxID=582686 RepID=A0A5S5BSY4_9BACL|nr:glycosyltransferase family 4 protein [Paenibacillus methanolicus]TYP70275.1 glycosyltransferase involved in cell wall biosynthesis [Paenibacillus methanolicus]